MGGYGSGRWGSHTKAVTVEEALGLPTTHVCSGLNMIADGKAPAWAGSLQWSRRGRVCSTIGYTITDRGGAPVVRLHYTTTYASGEKVQSDYAVMARSTAPYFGGRRWWWICPLTKRGRRCGRRVGKLYLPPGAAYFGCRHCHELTYESCQESHAYDGLFRRMGFDRAVAQRLLKWSSKHR